ncbi:hypothetical protein HAX54_017807 [Datura stramonium]|uniref:Uncharacterized protein n=1 Tax=Datura stramonium TaxID=4076 RepID=A0ABS8UNC1_DATST|nr:hypothetical protein [Datura stramonium]
MAFTIRKREEERRKAKEREEAAKKSNGAVATDQIHPSQAGKADGQEDVFGGLVGGQEKPIEPTSTSHTHPAKSKVVILTQNGQPQSSVIDSIVPTKKAKPNAQKRKVAPKKKVEFEAAQIASHHDKVPHQNFGKEATSDRSNSDVQTSGKRKTILEIQMDIDEADHFIYDHPQEAKGGQNISDDQVSCRLHSITESDVVPDLDPETPIDVHNPTPISCDPPDPMSDAEVKDFIDRQGLSPRGDTHFTPSSGIGPLATRTRLRVKNRHPHDQFPYLECERN